MVGSTASTCTGSGRWSNRTGLGKRESEDGGIRFQVAAGAGVCHAIAPLRSRLGLAIERRMHPPGVILSFSGLNMTIMGIF
jgi:hypothetical protein